MRSTVTSSSEASQGDAEEGKVSKEQELRANRSPATSSDVREVVESSVRHGPTHAVDMQLQPIKTSVGTGR